MAALTLALALAAQAPTGSARAPERLQLEVVLNGIDTSRIVAVLQDGERLLLTAATLRSFGIAIEGPDDSLVDVGGLPTVVVRYDAPAQRLAIDRSASAFPHQTLSSRTRPATPAAATTAGAVLNYDLHHQSHADTRTTGAWVDGRTFGSFGVLSTTLRYQHRAMRGPRPVSGVVRHDSTWVKTDIRRRITFSAGDVISGAHDWSRAVRVGGISIARNFAVRPDLVTYPVPEFAGEAVLPSAVDLLLDGRQVARRGVAPGPFTIEDVPVVNGAGSATVVTTDVLGRQTVRTLDFYVAGSLLKPGLVDYAATLGAVRQGYGVQSFGYGPFVGSGVVRYGATSTVTVEGQLTATGRATSGGAGARVGVGRFGVTGGSISLSRGHGDGRQLTARYEYQAHRFGLLVKHEYRTDGYVDAAQQAPRFGAVLPVHAGHLLQAFLSITARPAVPLTFGYVDSRGPAGVRTTLATFSTHVRVTSRARLGIAGTIRRGDLAIQMSFTMPLGATTTARAASTLGTDRDGGVRVSVHRPPPTDGGLGFDAAYVTGEGPDRHAAVTWRAPTFEAQAGVRGGPGSPLSWMSARGSLAAVGSAVTASARVHDAFIVVDAGLAGVPVLFENRPVGLTDRRGRLVIPGVSAYHAAQVAIDPRHLPLDVEFDVIEQRVAVERHAGTVVTFPVRRVRHALVRLVDASGVPLPVGLSVTHRESGRMMVVGWSGLVYIEHATPDNTLVIARPDGTSCVVSFTAVAADWRSGAAPTLECTR